MPLFTTRAGKSSALTHNEMDTNFKITTESITGADTVGAANNRNIWECDGTFTVTMGAAGTTASASDTDDFQITIKNISSGTITIARTGSDTFDSGATSITLLEDRVITLAVNTAGDGWNTISDTGAPVASIPDATTTVKGIIEIATNAEVETGTDTTRAITPSGLASLINFSKDVTGTDGYVILPGNVYLQWGFESNVAQNSGRTVTLPIAFPNACLQAVANVGEDPIHEHANSGPVCTFSLTTTTIVIFNGIVNAGDVQDMRWIAVGY